MARIRKGPAALHPRIPRNPCYGCTLHHFHARGECSSAEVAKGNVADLGVMGISLKDVVKPRVGFQGALQGAGTPNQAGIGGFLPLKVNANSIWFLDALANANFADYGNYSSIINTTVAGTTISSS